MTGRRGHGWGTASLHIGSVARSGANVSQPICLLALSALLLWSVPAEAQQVASLVQQPPVFASWRPAASTGGVAPLASLRTTVAPRQRTRNALIGGAIGTVAGLAVCTAISNMIDEGAAGFSTCTWKGYLLTGGVGLGVGFAVGWLL